MSDHSIVIKATMESNSEAAEQEDAINNNDNNNNDGTNLTAATRNERRKAAKKEKRKKKRKEMAELARLQEEARLNDPEEMLRLQAEEEMEKARAERERREFEEREQKIMEEWERKRAREEEEEKLRHPEEEDELKKSEIGTENNEDEDGWEYVEEGPPEIIWQGNEIIVKKKTIRVKKKETDQHVKEDPNRPTSNPFPPQSEAFADYKNASELSAQQLLENVAQQIPNFGTEQDKDHCPFHFKTGACRFGSRCSRIHFYPDKSCTLLIKNMYNGPGLAWEQDEGLECTDDEVERAFEEFYEDVHTEFLKFGEIINFKVCRNGSSHLRGNVYVHYKSLDSAVLAYQSVNARYFAGKQVQCEFVGVTKWKVAICGEFMKSRLNTCSRGMTCNFIHCFRNPGGDYEWADWDKPPPRYWVAKMAALFGPADESIYGIKTETGTPRSHRNSRINSPDVADRYHSQRSRSREIDHSRSSRHYHEDYIRRTSHRRHGKSSDPKQPEYLDEGRYDNRTSSKEKRYRRNVSVDSDSDRLLLDRDRGYDSSRKHSQSHRNEKLASQNDQSDSDLKTSHADRNSRRNARHRDKRSEHVDAAHSVATNLTCWYEDRYEPGNHNKESTSADDNWGSSRRRTVDCELSGDFSDEADRTRYTEKSERSDGYEEFDGKRYEKQRAGDECFDKGYGEVEHDNRSSYKYSDSSSRYYSRKDTCKSQPEQESRDDFKKSKRKRYADESYDSGKRIKSDERKRSRAACNLND